MTKGPLAPVLLLLALGAGLATGGCRRASLAAADAETYAEICRRRDEVRELRGALDVDVAQQRADLARERESWDLTLRETLALAATASRDYLRAREDVFLRALSLTGVRNRFRWLGAAGGGVGTSVDGDGSTVDGDASASASRNLERGGSVVVGFVTSFLESLVSGNPGEAFASILSADLLLPLARGSGWVAREDLTQAERDVLYEMRRFARFQQAFTVDIASAFYRVLQAQDTWENEERSYQSLNTLLERQEAMGASGAGRLADYEVDQTRQDLLRAEDRRLRARTRYETVLDQLKLTLGIPVTTTLRLDDSAFRRLREVGPVAPPYDLAAGIGLAAEHRLDLQNARGEEEDALRGVLVAKDRLRPEITLRLFGDLATRDTRGLDLTSLDPSALLALDLDLPVERTAERNAWRQSLITATRARRQRERLLDQILLEVREEMRSLAEARRSYAIQQEGVRLAERRVESTGLLLEAGQATTRDRLEAEDALVRARNELTGALVDHAIARLELELAVGTLVVDEEAWWEASPPGAPPAGGDGTPDGAPPSSPPDSLPPDLDAE